MKDVTKKHNYSMLFWNCHMAQENTREQLKIMPNNVLKYLDEDYCDNLEFFNSMR
jgi:hypothetical protein